MHAKREAKAQGDHPKRRKEFLQILAIVGAQVTWNIGEKDSQEKPKGSNQPSGY